MILICIIVIPYNTTPFIKSIRSQILILSLSDLIYDIICIRSASDYRKFTFSAKRKFIYIPGLERIGKIPIDYVIWGLNIYNTNMAIIHHAVCTKGITEKMVQMKKVNDYLE